MTTKAKNRVASLSRPSGMKIAAAPDAGPTSKYQAEAEQNLDRQVSTTPRSETILIVDDADDLFARRSTDKAP